MNFAVQRGQTVALVGRSGSGKTTAMHLLLRFWDPARGRIVLSGHDVRQYTLDTLRQQMALVSQDTYLFNASVRENLRLGHPEATDAALEQAARGPCARVYPAPARRLRHPPRGARYNFRVVNVNASPLRGPSSKTPPFCSSMRPPHLDSENERLVHEALKRLMAGVPRC